MANNAKLACVYLILSIIIFSCSSTKVPDKINGGFETSSSDNEDPDGWFPNRLSTSNRNIEFKLDGETAHGGGKSISISISKSAGDKSNIYNWVKNIEGLETKSVYELSGWIKTNNVKNSPFIEIQCWNRKADKLIAKTSTTKLYPIMGTKNWQNVKFMFNVPAGTTKVLILAGLPGSGNNGGKVWFDDIQIKKM